MENSFTEMLCLEIFNNIWLFDASKTILIAQESCTFEAVPNKQTQNIQFNKGIWGSMFPENKPDVSFLISDLLNNDGKRYTLI